MRKTLESQADEILLRDGKVFLDRSVISERGRRVDRDLLKRDRQRSAQRLNEAYSSLSDEARADLRNRYRSYNPRKVTVRLSWMEWLARELPDGLSLQRTSAGDQPQP